jgi:hygromycin-B 4-O-kinase
MHAKDGHTDALYPALVADFLRTHLGRPIQDIEPVGHGEWSRAFTFRSGAAEYVIRFSATDEDFLKDQRAVTFASHELPIPRIVDLGEAFGGYFALSERAQGLFLDTLDAPQLRAVLPSLWKSLDAARAVDLSTSHGFGVWGADGNAPHATWRAALLDRANDRPTSRIHGWRQRLASSPTTDGPFEEAYQRLTSLVEVCPETRQLVHADLLNYNLLIGGQSVSAVLDWGESLYGDFLFDIAWFRFWQPWYPAWREIDFAEEAARHYAAIALNVPNFEARLRCYEVVIGLDNQAYSAFKGRWEQLAAVAQRTLRIARGGQN